MSYSLSYHHVDHSPKFEEYIKEKMEKMGRLPKEASIQLVADKDGQNFSFSANMKGHHKHFYFKSDSSNIYKAANKVMSSIREWIRH